MERDAAAHAVHDGEDARLRRRFEGLVPLIPIDSLRQLRDSLCARGRGEPPTAAQVAAEEKLAILLETGAWPA